MIESVSITKTLPKALRTQVPRYPGVDYFNQSACSANCAYFSSSAYSAYSEVIFVNADTAGGSVKILAIGVNFSRNNTIYNINTIKVQSTFYPYFICKNVDILPISSFIIKNPETINI